MLVNVFGQRRTVYKAHVWLHLSIRHGIGREATERDEYSEFAVGNRAVEILYVRSPNGVERLLALDFNQGRFEPKLVVVCDHDYAAIAGLLRDAGMVAHRFEKV